MDYTHTALPSPINNPLLISLLALAFTTKLFHCISLCCFFSGFSTLALGSKYKSICVFLVVLSALLFLTTSLALVFHADLCTLPTIAIMNVCTFCGFALRQFEYYPGSMLMMWVCTLSSHITRGVSEVVDHYRGVFHMTCHVQGIS